MPDTRSATSAVPPPLPTRAQGAASAAPTLPLAAPVGTAVAPSPALAAPAPAPSGEAAPPSVAPAEPHSGALASADEAQRILSAALRGEVDADRSRRAAAERVVAALTEGERAALTSGPVASDAFLLRAAAVLRLRLDLAAGAAAEPAAAPAASALLAEVDDVLARIKAAMADPGPAAELEPVRRALVDGGVALAGALARAVSPATAPAPTPAPRVQVSARLLSNERPEAVSRGPRGLALVLVISLLVAGGYHGWKHATRSAAPATTFSNAPANTLGVERGGTRVLTALPGKRVDPAELASFREAERARGFTVRDAGPGTWIIERSEQPSAQDRTP